MNRQLTTLILLFPLLILLQVLICNHIMLFNVAIPFIFIYFIVRLPIGMSKNLLFTLAFLIGFCVDIFSDTPGVCSLASLILAVVKQPVFYAYVARDDKTKFITPCIATLGWQAYSKFILTLSAIFCLLTFSIEYFSFATVKDIALMTLGSTAITFVLLYCIDCLVDIGKGAYA